MKLSHLTTRAEAGGAQTHLLERLRGLHDGFELHVAVGEEGLFKDESQRIGLSNLSKTPPTPLVAGLELEQSRILAELEVARDQGAVYRHYQNVLALAAKGVGDKALREVNPDVLALSG